MRRCVLLFLFALLGCSVPDYDASVRVQAWLESLDADADVLDVRCIGNVEEPRGSGTWTEYERFDRWTAREVLAAIKNQGLDWDEVVARCIGASKFEFPKWLFNEIGKNMSTADRMLFKMSFHVDDVRCNGTPLRSPPPMPVRSCPNDIDGCDDAPPMASDLPPPLPPPGGGDF
jgi:hypothetical protein